MTAREPAQASGERVLKLEPVPADVASSHGETAKVEPHRLFDDSLLRFLPAPVREPRRAWLAIPVAYLLTFVGSVVLSFATRTIAPQLDTPEFPMSGGLAMFMLVVFAPFVETLIMAAVLAILLRFVRPAWAVLLSAAGWGIAHSMEALGWGLVIWWPFLIFSTLFVVWRQRSVWAGIGVAAATHALQNLLPALTVAYPHLVKGLG